MSKYNGRVCVRCGGKIGSADLATLNGEEWTHISCTTTPKLLSEENAGLRDFLWNTGMFDKLNHDDHVKLTRFISQQKQLYADQKVREIERAYGGCHNCYGKGYSTVKSQINGYGTDGDIGGFEGRIHIDMPVQMKYCDCDRGKQLAERTRNNQGKAE